MAVHPRGGGDKVTRPNGGSRGSGSSPRGRGQGPRILPGIERCSGSSPRGRGQVLRHVRKLGIDRFIPAGAGTRGGKDAERGARTVHPRGGGDKLRGVAGCNRQGGSSPRGRGQGLSPESCLPRHRFIPAGAGTRHTSAAIARIAPVHPRGGGDKPSPTPTSRSASGSSPRGRGQGHLVRAIQPTARFIPAGAGTRCRLLPLRLARAVHPRGGGDKFRKSRASSHQTGSSPRGRGQGLPSFVSWSFSRFIPAGAGTSWSDAAASYSHTVHPRGGGDKPTRPCGSTTMPGSSPRGRGQAPTFPLAAGPRRFIPAGAGTSYASLGGGLRRKVHPRGGGDKRTDDSLMDSNAGSSPRGRGQGRKRLGKRGREGGGFRSSEREHGRGMGGCQGGRLFPKRRAGRLRKKEKDIQLSKRRRFSVERRRMRAARCRRERTSRRL